MERDGEGESQRMERDGEGESQRKERDGEGESQRKRGACLEYLCCPHKAGPLKSFETQEYKSNVYKNMKRGEC
jgi:hypothetical protein